MGLWWDEEGAGFVVAAGFRRTAGYTWLADGSPLGDESAMTALRARLGLDPVLDAAAFDRLTRPDSDADAPARVLGLIAVLARAGLRLPPGLAPGTSAQSLRDAVGMLASAEAVEWPGWRQAVRTGLDGEWIWGTKARALGGAEVAVGLGLLALSRRRRGRAWQVAGAALFADGALTLAYDAWRGAPERLSRPAGARGAGVLLVVLVVQAGQPGRQALHRHLEVRVEVDELAQALGHPAEGDLLLAPPVLQLLDAAVGEVQRELRQE
ncbi:hypothetical protein GCM10020000_26350 [Streptomyces olivoverticillatus]